VSDVAYGIDFGTSASAVVVARADGTITHISDPASRLGSLSIPSSVCTWGGQLVVGTKAEHAKAALPKQFRSGFKRDFGSTTPTPLNGDELLPDELTSILLGFLREQAAAQVPGPVHRVVITVPAAWQAGKRGLMIKAAERAGFDPETVELIDEPVAALEYAFGARGGSDPRTVLVYDLGGGTFDCAVAVGTEDGYRVIGSPSGLDDVGGVAFDWELMRLIRARCGSGAQALLDGPPADDDVLRKRLSLGDRCEEIKWQLSADESVNVLLSEILPPVMFEVSRADLEEAIRPMLARTLVTCERMLDAAGLSWDRIDQIVPVGGSSRIPLVGRMLAEQTGRTVLRVKDPELAIVRGAARLAHAHRRPVNRTSAATFDDLRAQTLGLAETVLDRAKRRGLAQSAKRLADAIALLAEGKLKVVVCGEFNRGKSSLLNALLDDKKDLFPTGVIQKTRLITTVEYGQPEQVFVNLTRPDGTVERRPITRAEIANYAAEPDDAAAANVDDGITVEIMLPDPRLKSGLVLVDTPGVGGIYQAHSRITNAFLPDANAIIFVTSVDTPMREPELRFLATAGDLLKAADRRDSLLVVLNMIDQCSDYAGFLAETQRRVAERTGQAAEAITVIPVSAADKLHYLETDNEAFLEESRIASLEEALWAQLARRRIRVLLGETLQETIKTAGVLVRPLQAIEAGLRDRTGKELANLAERAEARKQRLRQLTSEGAQWRDETRRELTGLGQEMTDRVRVAFDAIWSRAETELLSQEWYLVQPARLEEQLRNDFRIAMAGVNDWGGRKATALQRDCAQRYDLDVRGVTLGGGEEPPILDLPSYNTLQSQTRRVYHSVSSSSGGGGYVSASGSSPGFFGRAAMKVGRFFGGERGEQKVAEFLSYDFVPASTQESGYWTEVDDGISAAQMDRRRSELLADMRDRRPRQQALTDTVVGDRIRLFAEAIAAEMDSLITSEVETLEETLSRLDHARERTEEEAKAQLADLAAETQPLLTALEGAERLAAEAAERLTGVQGGNPL
jgi:actin-like ATPase involved in cell morphogenesis/GTPase Era involved in 16S rRNA processing